MLKIFLFIPFFAGYMCFAQQFTGVVKDQQSHLPIPFVDIQLVEFDIQNRADSNGLFNISGSLPKSVVVQFSASGYETKLVNLICCDQITVTLEPDLHDLNEVIITAQSKDLNGSKTQKTDYLSLKKMGILAPLNIMASIEQLEGVQLASYGPLNAKPVIRGMQGMRVVTFLNGMRVENQQWGADHGLGISQVDVGSAEVIKGPMSLIYAGDATGGLIYLKDAPFAPQNSYSVDLTSQFETASLGTQNALVYKTSGKKLRLSMAGTYSSYADYALPNQRFLSDSRMRDAGAKFNLGYNTKKWNFKLNYLYSNSIIGIPGHTHDLAPSAESFMYDEQNRSKSLPHQLINNHFVNLQSTYFIDSKNKVDFIINHGYNNLQEYEEKIFTPGIDMYLNASTLFVRHQWRPNSKVQILSGVQSSIQFNSNGAEAEEVILLDSRQQDIGMYSSISVPIKKMFFNATLRLDNRNISSAPFAANYTNLNGSLGLRRNWKGENLNHDISLHLSSGSRAPHTTELLSDGVHHGTNRYELGDTALRSERFFQLDLNYDFSNEHLSFVLNPFVTYANNFIQIAQQDSVIDNMDLWKYEQMDAVLIYGLEARLHYHPHFAHFLHLETGYSQSYGETAFNTLTNKEFLYFMPQSRLRSNVRVDLSKSKKYGFASVLLQHFYFFKQDRFGPLESSTDDYHLLQLAFSMRFNHKWPLELSFGVRNALNSEYINHLSRLKSLGLTEPGRSFYINAKWNIKGKIK
tara:strand:- start:158 stop:2398 length:2241 start_codon:yes stop_codon:yes gene_type:complete